MKFTREWETLTNNMGYWVDLTEPYITYDNRYIESVWWLLDSFTAKAIFTKDIQSSHILPRPAPASARTSLTSPAATAM